MGKYIFLSITVFIFIGFFWLGPQLSQIEYAPPTITVVASFPVTSEPNSNSITPAPNKIIEDNRLVVTHRPLPVPLKAIYMTACVAGTPSFRNQLVTLIEETEINAVMIDIKDFSGTISFPPINPTWQPAWQASKCGARDMKAFIETLHAKDIFVIGRITVFQDPFAATRSPHLAVKRADGQTIWTDHKGLAFIDVAAREYWDHIVDLAVESYNLGFDELNFDYVRYPSDGNMQDISFPHTEASEWGNNKPANLEAFFAYLHKAMINPDNFSAVRHTDTGRLTAIPWTSVDLFGLTTTSYNDLSIGQVQERAAPYFDFVAPMVYPSHYPANFMGIANPNDKPYDIVYHAMKSGVARMQATTTRVDGFLHERIGTSTPALYTKPAYDADRLRTWIQDFNYGGVYDATKVRAQIQASYDAGVESWMLWAPSNRYTRNALLPAKRSEAPTPSETILAPE